MGAQDKSVTKKIMAARGQPMAGSSTLNRWSGGCEKKRSGLREISISHDSGVIHVSVYCKPRAIVLTMELL